MKRSKLCAVVWILIWIMGCAERSTLRCYHEIKAGPPCGTTGTTAILETCKCVKNCDPEKLNFVENTRVFTYEKEVRK